MGESGDCVVCEGRGGMRVTLLMQDTRSLYGAERSTVQLARGLKEAGAEVRVLLLEEARLGGGEGSELAAALGGVAEVRGVKVEGRLSREARDEIRAAMAEWGGVLHSTGYKADVHAVWAAEPEEGGTGGRFPVVSTVHGWLFRRDLKEWVFREANLRALRRCARVVALSEFYERYLRRRGVRPLQLALEPPPYGGAWPEAEVREGIWKGEGPMRFGMLGRLSEEKDPVLFLKALRRLERKLDAEGDGHRWEAVLAGDGGMRARLERLIRKWGLEGRVRLAGRMESGAFFRGCHVLVQCSRVENRPLSVLEAMAWGRPVAATRAGGLPELVREGSGGNGALTERGDAKGLAEVLERWLKNPAEAQEAGERGRRMLEGERGAGAWVAGMLGVYEGVLAGRGGGGTVERLNS